MKAPIQNVILSTLDAHLPAMTAVHQSVPQPAGGWLRTVRQALGLAQAAVSAKAGITQQAYAQFETGEASSTISLGRLRHAAGAMDCELVYFFMPRRDRAESFTKLATGLDPDLPPAHAAEHSLAPASRAGGELPVELR